MVAANSKSGNQTENSNKAYIKVLNGSHKGEKYQVHFNPENYSIDKSNQFQNTAIPGLAPVTQFVSGNQDTLTLELLFDTYMDKEGEDVRKYTSQIAALMDIDSELHAPPICEFGWGGAYAKHLPFTATIQDLKQQFTMFKDDGTPVRAKLTITFKQYQTIEEQLAEIKRQSADRSKRKIFKEGDSLWMIAFEEYGDPGYWRIIAHENNIDNPNKISAGREILLPAIE